MFVPADLRRFIDAGSLARGRHYWADGRVQTIEVQRRRANGWNVTSTLRGSGRALYAQDITVKLANGVLRQVEGECDCPVGHNCKHVAAALLAWAERTAPSPAAGRRSERPFSALSGPSVPAPTTAADRERMAPADLGLSFPVRGLLAPLDAAALRETAEQYADTVRKRLLYVLCLDDTPSGERTLVLRVIVRPAARRREVADRPVPSGRPGGAGGRRVGCRHPAARRRRRPWHGQDPARSGRRANGAPTTGAVRHLAPLPAGRARLAAEVLAAHGFGGILADDMGLGKTLQALAHLLVDKEAGRLERPSLLVAPTSVLGNWRAEVQRFAPGLRTLVLHGPQRKAAQGSLTEYDLVVTSYALLPRDRAVLAAQPWRLAIFDEAQYLKNPTGQRARRHRPCRHASACA